MGIFDNMNPKNKTVHSDRPSITVAVPTEDGEISVTAPSKPIQVDLDRLNAANNRKAEMPISIPEDDIFQSVEEHEKVMGVDTKAAPDFGSLEEFRKRSMRNSQLLVAPEDLKNGENTKEYEISSARVIQSYESARRAARLKNKKSKRVMLGIRVTENSRTWLKRRMFEKNSDMTEWILGAMNKRLHDEGINDIIID